ncbi:hypothetical protein D1007_56102 [Hordeum vulgare]|nr:hypothetical protein D1007_56102 [Hordeum vulgare]
MHGKQKNSYAHARPIRALANFRREPIWFEVVNLTSSYQVIFGRPALAKVMAVPHYAYLKLKLSGQRGIITVSGNYKKSSECVLSGRLEASHIAIKTTCQCSKCSSKDLLFGTEASSHQHVLAVGVGWVQRDPLAILAGSPLELRLRSRLL